MKKWLASLLVVLFAFLQESFVYTNKSMYLNRELNAEERNSQSMKEFSADLFTRINPYHLSFKALELGIKGYYQLLLSGKLSNNQYLSIIDFTQSSNVERMIVFDTHSWNVVRTTLVAHGVKSGQEFATDFSNTENSHQSSLGFYLTGEIYDGKHGYSLKLDGLEFSNDKARERGVVIHGADYVSHQFIDQNGRLGRSHGCPALPREGYTELVDRICGGSCVFIYGNDSNYLKKSTLCNAKDNWLVDCNGQLSSI
jgi:hypothetical protein